MRVRSSIAVTLAAVMAVSSFGINAASAAPAAALPSVHQNAANDAPLIEVASKKKRHRGNNAAAAAAFAGIAGAMIGLAIQESQRDRYYRGGGYYYGDGPYYGGRTYYRGRSHQYAQPRTYYRDGIVSDHPNPQLRTPGPQNYGPGPHPPIQNWGLDR
jgi:hypothetical protein